MSKGDSKQGLVRQGHREGEEEVGNPLAGVSDPQAGLRSPGWPPRLSSWHWSLWLDSNHLVILSDSQAGLQESRLGLASYSLAGLTDSLADLKNTVESIRWLQTLWLDSDPLARFSDPSRHSGQPQIRRLASHTGCLAS